MRRTTFDPSVALAVLLAVVLGAGAGFAATPPDRINYQGVLRSSGGTPLDGTYDMVFRFFDSPTAGNEIVVDRHTSGDSSPVIVSAGLFNVGLGDGLVLDGAGPGTVGSLAELFGDFDAVHLEIEIEGEVLAPRVRVTSAAYALNARTLGGDEPAFYIDRANHAGTQPASTIAPQGDGSGLDADTVDGLDASGILEAASPCALHQFVGVTTAFTAATVGWKGMSDRCQSELGAQFPGVRMCFSEEIMRTPTSQWPALGGHPVGFWVHPVLQPTLSTAATDISGIAGSPGGLTCDGWDNISGGTGLYLKSFNGAFSTTGCNSQLAVSCCAPLDEIP